MKMSSVRLTFLSAAAIAPPASGPLTRRSWLVSLLRGLGGLLLAGLILEVATSVIQRITLVVAVMMTSPYLALAGQSVGVAEVLRLQAALPDRPRAAPWDNATDLAQP